MWCMKTGATRELCLSRECAHKRRHYFKQTTSAWALLIIKWSSRATSLMVAYSNGCMGFTAARSVHPSIVQSLTFRYLFLSTWHTKLVLPPNQNLFCTSRESKCSFVKQSPIWKHLSPSMNSFVCNVIYVMMNGVMDQGLFHHFFPSDLVHHILTRVKRLHEP